MLEQKGGLCSTPTSSPHFLLQLNIPVLSVHPQLMFLQNLTILAVEMELLLGLAPSMPQDDLKRTLSSSTAKRWASRRETAIQTVVLQSPNAATTQVRALLQRTTTRGHLARGLSMQPHSGVNSVVKPGGGTIQSCHTWREQAIVPVLILACLSPELHLTLLGSWNFCSLNLFSEWEGEHVTQEAEEAPKSVAIWHTQGAIG